MSSYAQNISPTLSLGTTQGAILNQGITYNQSNLTYNESGYSYGGFYGSSDIKPLLSLASNPNPIVLASKTQQSLNNPGITYNESGKTYNELLYTYGGIYGFADVMPLITLALQIQPTIANYADIYTPGGTIPVGQGIYTPLGLLLVLTHFRQ